MQESGPRVFTLEEANELLPEVRQILKQMRVRLADIQKFEEKKAVEELSWLREDGTISPNAEKEVSRIDTAIEGRTEAFEKELEQLSALGAQLKDIDEGLVDFFASRGDELVYLCWKEGEERIGHWHDIHSGFSGRQPIDTL